MSTIHPQARTTPQTRREIRRSKESQASLAKRFSVSKLTIRKWRSRDDVEDRSHRPSTLQTTLSPIQEEIAVVVRESLLLPLDDLLVILREFVNPNVSRSGLDRCLRRHGVPSLRELQSRLGKSAPVKAFKDYVPGFVHIDVKYLPQMPDERARKYLFVAIDRATRWVFLRVYGDQSETSATDFLQRLHHAAPMNITKVLTDNGSQFTDRFTRKTRTPSGEHAFDRRCADLGIEHRLTPPRHPQTNGMVERFNGRIAELLQQTRFTSAAELAETLTRYAEVYNHRIPQRALDHRSPIQALKDWRNEKPQLFNRRAYELAGPDT